MILVENNMLMESTKTDKHWYIEGVFAQAGVVNRNRRIYEEATLDREVNKFVTEKVKVFQAVGELSHPNHSNINPDRAAILIESLTKDGADYIGRAKVLSTPCGKLLESLISDGVKVGVSTRGAGSVSQMKEGISKVNSDFQLYTIDAVLDPSAPKAIVSAVYENLNMLEDTMLQEEFMEFLRNKKKLENIPNKFNRENQMYEQVKMVLSKLISK